MLRTVIERASELTLDNCTTSNGYAFDGTKGTFILARNVDGKFIWVRLTPGKTSKPVNEFATIKDAIKSKLELGYDVYAFDDVADLVF